MYVPALTHFLLATGLAWASSAVEATVHESISPEDLTKLLTEGKAIMASFQTSCSAWTALLPELHRVAQSISSVKALSRTQVIVATIDCDATKSKTICESFDIHSYPTIRLINSSSSEGKESWTRFRGPRKGYALTSFLSRHLLPSISRPKTREALDELLLADSSVLVLQTKPSGDTGLTESIAAQAAGKLTFGVVDTPKLTVAQKDSPSLLCYRNGEDYTYTAPIHPPEAPRALTGDDVRSSANVELFVEHCAAPQVFEFNRRKMNQLYGLRKPIVYIFTDKQPSIRGFLIPVQRAWAGVVPFVHVDVNEHPDLVGSLGLRVEDGFPAAVVEGVINDQVYPMPPEWEVEPDNMDAFVGGILHGKAEGGREGMAWVKKAGLTPRLKSGSSGVRDEL